MIFTGLGSHDSKSLLPWRSVSKKKFIFVYFYFCTASTLGHDGSITNKENHFSNVLSCLVFCDHHRTI